MATTGDSVTPGSARQQNTIITTTRGRMNVASAGSPQGTAVANTANNTERAGRIALIAAPALRLRKRYQGRRLLA